MFGYDWPRLHAAVNDLPAALLLTAVLFDLAAWGTKRKSLDAAALWTLWAGVVGGWTAVIAGLQAEKALEHGTAIHDLMKQHERQALVTMGVFTAILGYKLLRRARLTTLDQLVLRGLGVVGLLGIVYTGLTGGNLVFEHAAGIPSATMQAEMENRVRGHAHEPGSAPAHEHPAAPDTAKAAGGHTHPPGTKPHRH
jgi:uncharacterized membrane protein